MKLSKYILSTDLLDDVNLPNQRIIFSTRTSTSILIEELIYQKVLACSFAEIEPEILSTLISKEFFVPDDQNEFEYVLTANGANKKDGSFLSMTIQPSANCQLGCHYCGQNHSKHYASDAVIDKYYERIVHLLEEKRYTGMAITWYGGEPLTGYTAIKKTSKKLIALCKEKGMSYQSDMITNGLGLKTSMFEELVTECKVTNYQITLDGTAESHDQRRITKTGDPTFDIITKNIIDVTQTETYSRYNCNISIRVNIDKTNYQYVDPLIDLIKDNDLQKKVTIYFAPVVDFGGNDAGKDGLNKDFFAQREIDWLLKCYENDMRVHTLPERTYSVCMVDRKDSEVLDAFGNIYACWEFPYSGTYAQGDSLIGNLFQPAETYNMDATLRNWDEVLQSGKTWCKTCTHLPVCGGGCPKSWHEGTPACPPFKFNYKDKLLLDYYMRKNKKTEELV
jgi:uncharacterized protein